METDYEGGGGWVDWGIKVLGYRGIGGIWEILELVELPGVIRRACPYRTVHLSGDGRLLLLPYFSVFGFCSL